MRGDWDVGAHEKSVWGWGLRINLTICSVAVFWMGFGVGVVVVGGGIVCTDCGSRSSHWM